MNASDKKTMLRVGTLLHGTYRIDDYLSSGGFGNTYVATNIQFEERVAIKEFFIRGVSERDGNNTTVSVSNADNNQTFAEQMAKFKKEARRLRKLQSPNIVRVYDLFEENGTAYYVMDFIQGENLSERLKHSGVPMSESEALSVLRQVLSALKTAHEAGILHLDLKPGNIMMEAGGKVKLIDFGASKQQRGRGGATTSTAVSYTNGYAPREQMEQNIDKFGPWTDFYALGATLYTLLTNQKPHMPSEIDEDRTPDKHLALPMPEYVTPRTKHLVLWLMATSRLDRPQSVAEIEQYLDGGTATTNHEIDDNTMRAGQSGDDETHLGDRDKNGNWREQDTPEPDDRQSEQSGLTTDNGVTYTDENGHLFFRDDNGNFIPVEVNNGSSGLSRQRKIVIGLLVFFLIVLPVSVMLISQVRRSLGIHSSGENPAYVDSVATDGHYRMNGDSITIKSGRCKYVGQVDPDGVPDGDGEAWFSDGRYYKGNFYHGAMQSLNGSKGFFSFGNGDTYKGTFADNHFDQGTYTVAEDKSYFTGYFDAEGQPSVGSWYDAQGHITETVKP